MGFEPRTLRFTVLHSTTELSWFVVKWSSFLLFINSAEILRGFQGLKKIAEQCYWEGPEWTTKKVVIGFNQGLFRYLQIKLKINMNDEHWIQIHHQGEDEDFNLPRIWYVQNCIMNKRQNTFDLFHFMSMTCSLIITKASKIEGSVSSLVTCVAEGFHRLDHVS